jgi:hypothetical protein
VTLQNFFNWYRCNKLKPSRNVEFGQQQSCLFLDFILGEERYFH